jgi:chromate transporter
VGVILNLAIWFGLHVLFREITSFTYGSWTMDLPVLTSLSLPSLVLTLLAAIAIFRLKMSVISTLLASAALGVGWAGFVS